MANDEYLNIHAALFYQKEPTAALTHLNEISLSDFRLSGREAGSAYESPVSARRSDFYIKGFLPGGLILPGFAAQRPLMEINYLWSLTKEGLVNFTVTFADSGTETDPENYDIALVFVGGEVVSPALEGGKAMQSGDAARNMSTFMVQSVSGYEKKPLSNASRLTTADDQLATGIFVADKVESGTLRRRTGQHLVLSTEAIGAGTANVGRSIDYGNTWTLATADPFAADEDPIDPLIIDLPQEDKYRVIVFRASTDAANPSECAYTDVTPGTAAWAAAWTAVDIGGTNAWFITAAYKVHDGLILCGDDQGNVYYSKNKGVSWTLASYGGSNDVRCFTQAPDGTLWAGGDSTEVYYSEDDGVTWNAVTTAPAGAVTAIAVNYEGYVFIVDNVTLLKYSADKGLSWNAVTVTAEAVTELKEIIFDEHGYTGIILVDDAGADDRLFRTEDGGMNWIAQTTGTSNTGYNVAALPSPNLVYIGGDVVSTTWIEKVFGPGEGS
jgi:hypothetical protein